MELQYLAKKYEFHKKLVLMLEMQEQEEEDKNAGRLGERLRLQELGDNVWIQQFRFTQSEVYRLVRALDMPEHIQCPLNGIVEDCVTALCMLLRRLAYPIRLADVELFFGWERSRFSRISRATAAFLWQRWKHLLRFDPIRLSPSKLSSFGEFVHEKGAPLSTVVAFLDGTLRKNARPIRNQRMVFNGWKRIHCLKYHVLLSPDGIAIHVYGPVEGRRHDQTVYKESGLADLLDRHFRTEDGRPLYIFGDSGYVCKGQVLSPFKGQLSEEEQMWNESMSKVREPVEWVFGEITKQFPFLDFSRNQKLLLQPCALYYLVGILLCNAHTILHQPQTPQYFHCPPPSLDEYFHGNTVDDTDLDEWCMTSPWTEVEVQEDNEVEGEEDNEDIFED